MKGAGASPHSSSGRNMLLEVVASIATMAIQVVKYCHCTRGVVQRKSGRPMVPHALFAYSDASHASCPIMERSVLGEYASILY